MISRIMWRVAYIVGSGLLGLGLSGCGGGGGGPPAVPKVYFSVTPSTVNYGGTATLLWSSVNATGCTALWAAGSLAASGSVTLTGLVGTGSFSITCTGAGGTASASAPITVIPLPLPTVSINAASAIVAEAGTDTLTWTTTGAIGCVATDGWTGTQPTSGSSQVGPITKQTLYTLTCDGAGGVVSSSVTVGVSSTLPPAGPIATLAPGVLVFTGPVLQQSSNFVVFSGGPTPVLPGQVFVLGGTAYKVTAAQPTSEELPPSFLPFPVVQVSAEPPALDELFGQIDISGTFTLDASQTVAQSAAAQALSAKRMRLSLTTRPDAAALIPLPLNLDFPPLQIHGNSNLAMQATANLHYSQAAGFTNSSIVLNTGAQASVTVSSTIALSQSITVPAGHFRIPIPLTVVDGQSNLVAVMAASIDVPVFVVANPSIAYGLSYDANLQGSASTTVTIANDGTVSATVGAGAIANTIAITNPTASPSANTPAAATLWASLFAGMDISSSLQLLNTVNLVTVDERIGDRYKADLTILTSGSSPTYCGGVLGDLEFQASASLILSSNVYTTPVQPPLISELSALGPQPNGSYCGTQSIVTGSPSAPAVLFSPLTIAVNVVQPPTGSSPLATPSGVVQATLDGVNCEATIDGTGNGSCNLTPATPGMRTMTLQYLGDSNFPASAVASEPLDVTLAQPVVALSFAPNPASYSSTVTFNFTVSPAAQSAGAPVPTGSVTVMGFNDGLCTSVIDNAGHGSCTLQMPSITQQFQEDVFFPTLMTTAYAGDDNYLSASSAGAPLPVIELLVKYPAGALSVPVGQAALLVVSASNVFTQAAVPTPPNLQWTSSTPTVATVAAGTVSALAPGTSTITVTDPVSLASASIVATVVNSAP